jgi:hypothetical protein
MKVAVLSHPYIWILPSLMLTNLYCTRITFTLSTLGFKIMESHSAPYSQATDFDLQSAVRAQNVKALMNRYNRMEGLVKRLTEVGKCCIHLIIFH